MTAFSSPGGSGISEILAAELAPREGRWEASSRIAIATTLTVAIAMTFRIPEAAYMAYIVFLISKDDRSATVTSGIGGLAAVTLAVLVTLGLSLVDLDEPALRIPAMALMTFIAMYTTRTFALGELTYLAGFVIVLLHSLIDDVPSTEVFTRATLWIWVIAAVPVAITVVMHALFGHDIQVTVRRAVRKVLQELKDALIQEDFLRPLPQWRRTLVPLLEAKRAAEREDDQPVRIGNDAIVRLLDALTILEVVPATLPARIREVWSSQVGACLRIIDGADPVSSERASTRERTELNESAGTPDQTASSPAVLALTDSLFNLQNVLAQGERSGGASQPPGHEKVRRALFVPDAFTNPSHWQFALKTTLAVMASYAIYTLLDWPGIRTAIVTCFFVALGSLGETVHKLILRLSGALIGGVIAGLCIVFVLPHFTDIGQLSILIALVSLGAAWIATSSEILAYAGLQIAFAFFLGILQDYSPATDLTVLRDRVVGIVLGNVLITIVFTSLWPESARTGLRSALSEAMHSLARVLKENAAEARTRVAQALTKAEHFRALSSLELRLLTTSEPDAGAAPALAAVERMAGATFVATAQPVFLESNAKALTQLGDWMETSADRMARHEKLPDVPDVELPDDPSPGTRGRIARRAVEQLKSEIGDVASATD